MKNESELKDLLGNDDVTITLQTENTEQVRDADRKGTGAFDFEKKTVLLNSGYEMLECSLEGFAREENCYQAHFDRLPEEELSFTMCSTAAPKKKTNGIVYVIIGYFVFLLLGSLLLIYLIARLIKKIFTRK